jgi:hypothetical protein
MNYFTLEAECARLWSIRTAALLAFWVAGSSLAGDAVFSNDGQRIYAIANADYKLALREINLTKQTSRTISLSQLPSQQPLLGITRSDGDKLFCVTEKNIWTFDPRSNRLTKICGSPNDCIHCRKDHYPQSHAIIVKRTGERWPLFLYKNGLVSVYVRRHDAISSPVFAADGTLFYSETGDLWSGKIESNEGIYSLTATRYLPLAYLETANTTPGGMGVSEIAPAKDSVYVQLFRMGGSGWGAMFQVPRPPVKEHNVSGLGQLAEFELTRYKELLDGLKPLGENDQSACLCASPDETRVYYTNEGKDYLITNGQTAELHLTKAATMTNAQVSSEEPAPVATDVTPPSESDIQYGIDVVQKQVAAMSARDVDTLVSLYGDNVDYLDKGNVSSDVVRKELQAYFDKWPVVKWEVKGVIQSRLVGQSNYNVTFAVAFEVSNPATKKRVAGTATETEMLAPDASGNKKIISQHEKITREPDASEETLSEKGLKSETGNVKARITFVNRSKQPLKVYWLDYNGERVLYKKLKPSESYTQDTYMTHPWLITDLYDNAWDVYMPTVQPRTVIITAPKKR